MIKQCVARIHTDDLGCGTNKLKKLLSEGWRVINSTPYILEGTTEFVEYILEKDCDAYEKDGIFGWDEDEKQ